MATASSIIRTRRVPANFAPVVDGDGLPAWVPAAGTFADVSLNEAADVNPCPASNCTYSGTGGVNAAFDSWTSGIFAPELGALGSYVCWGGGHGAGSANNVFRFDLSTRLWSSMGTPSNYSGDDIDSIGALPDGKPGAPHTYHTLGIRSSANGGGTYGSLISAGLPGISNVDGGGRFARWWQFDFETETWSQFFDSSGINEGSLTSKTMVQEPGSHFWWFGSGYLEQVVRVTQAGSITTYSGVDLNTGGEYCGGVVPGTRIAVLHGNFGATETWLFDLAAIEASATGSSARKQVSTTGTAGGGGSSLAWNPDVQGFASINDASPTTVRWLKPSNPSDPWGSTWAWTAETLSAAGGASTRSVPTGNQGRFVYAPTIKCHLWATLATVAAQAYRPAGT